MKKLATILICVLLSLFWVSSLTAQEGLIVSPPQINIAVEKGQTVTRTLLIRAGEPVANLRVIPLDLTGPNGTIVLPAEAISIAVPTTSIAANAEVTVPVTFNLANVPSGQFTGELLISYTGQSYTVPVSVAVKDKPWLPLAALVVGVTLGIGVSTYRAQGRPRDEVLVRLGQIRTQMKIDKALQEIGTPFYTRIDAEMVDVEVALEGQQWEKARQAVMEAEALWTRWRRGRPDWLVQLEYYDKLNEKLESLGESIFYVNEVKEAARNCFREMPNLEGPSLFRAQLDPLTRQINSFITLNSRIDELAALNTRQSRASARTLQQRLYALAPIDNEGYQNLQSEIERAFGTVQKAQVQMKATQFEEMCTKLPEADVQIWLPKARELKSRIASLEPDDYDAVLAVESEVDVAMQQIEPLMPYREKTIRGAESVSFGTPKGLAAEAESWLSSPPTIHVQSLPDQIAGAGRRLRWFTWLTYAVAVIFLALAGFVELYNASPDFGANGIGDYFTLLAWGFGAEATRAAIADMVQGWSISTGK